MNTPVRAKRPAAFNFKRVMARPSEPEQHASTQAGGGGASGSGPRVLIVRPSALGDVSRTVPALVTLRSAWPDARIDWLVSEAYADAVRHHPALDGVVTFPRKRFGAVGYNPRVTAEALAWAWGLRRRGYDWVFDLQGLFRSGLFTRLTGAKHRVGFANARELAWLGYNRRHRVDPRLHTVDRMLGLLEAEGHAPSRDMRLYVGQDDREWLGRWLGESGASGESGVGGRYACIAPTAKWLCKCWPIERYIEIARRLLDTGLAGQSLVVLAGPGERAQVQPLLDAFAQDPRVLAPQTTVGRMMALLSGAGLLVSNDSAALHIAVGFGRPVVAVFGPTDPALVGPYRRDDAVVGPADIGSHAQANYRRHRDDQTLIAQVSVDAVWGVAQRQVERGGDDIG